MSLMLVILKKLFGFFHSLLACFKRMLCFLRIRAREPDVLPFSVANSSYDSLPPGPLPGYDSTYANSSSTGQGQSWDSWNTRVEDRVEDKIEAYRQKMVREKEEEERRRISGESEMQKEPDYFQEIAPDVKKIKTKKIVLKQKSSTRNPSNLFSIQSSGPLIPEPSDELGTLDDTGYSESWDVDDTELDVDTVMKEARQKERSQRQQRRKEQRHRLTSTGSGGAPGRGFEAVRLS